MADPRAWRKVVQEGYPARIHPFSRPQLPGPEAIGLGGTGLVGDDLYLLAHHDVTGRPLLSPRPLGIGLAGALLAELMLGASIGLSADARVTVSRRWPDDDLAHWAWDRVAAEREPVLLREWLVFFAYGASMDIAQRLERAGCLGQVRGLLPWRPGRWVPADPSVAFAPIIRVRSALDPSRPLDPRHAALAGLAEACGLGFRIAQARVPGTRTAEQTVSQLGPQLRYLIAQTQAAAGNAVLSHRT